MMLQDQGHLSRVSGVNGFGLRGRRHVLCNPCLGAGPGLSTSMTKGEGGVGLRPSLEGRVKGVVGSEGRRGRE